MRKSLRALHKWVGLVGLFWFVMMALSGIGLNHPDLIAEVDLPRSALPGDYEYRNWNRASLRGVLNLPGNLTANAPSFIYGEAGVWDLRNGRAVAFNDGLPPSYFRRDVRALNYKEDTGLLYAATRGGLFARKLSGDEGRWNPVELPGAASDEAVVELTSLPGRVLALTRSRLYLARDEAPLNFSEVDLTRTDDSDRKESLFRLIFEMHGGEAWGLPGRLTVDFVGVAVVFFSVTGGWFWWRKKKRTLARGRSGKLVRQGLKLHIKWGLWLTLPIVFISLTGALERPPLLILIAGVEYPAKYSPTPHADEPWRDKLRKALYDAKRDAVVFSTADGYYSVGARMLDTGSAALRPMRGGPPVSVMGANVFEARAGDRVIVGSMSGLFEWDRGNRKMVDLYTGAAPKFGGRPVGDWKVMGCAELGEPLLCADYDAGLVERNRRPAGVGALAMPEELSDGGRISLWHFLFELHNGRVFSFIMGWWTWVLVPLLGLSLAFEVISGFCDKLWPNKRETVKSEGGGYDR